MKGVCFTELMLPTLTPLMLIISAEVSQELTVSAFVIIAYLCPYVSYVTPTNSS